MDDSRGSRYFGRAWRSLLGTRNLFGKLLALALIQLVPVLGQIVALGYFLGWAREAAWGMETPLPPHVLGMGDEGFWARGAKAFAAGLLYAVLAGAFWGALAAGWPLAGIAAGLDAGGMALAGAFAWLLCIAGGLFLAAMSSVGLVRLAIYDRFGAAFQWGVACKMLGRRLGGAVKVMGSALLAGLALAAASALVGLALVPGLAGTGALGALASYLAGLADLSGGDVLPFSLFAGMVLCLLIPWAGVAVCGFLLSLPALMAQALLWRTLGNWVACFDVPSWGGRHDRLPFERERGALGARGEGEGPDACRAEAPDPAACPAAVCPPSPERRCHPALVCLLSIGAAVLVGLASSGLALSMLWTTYRG